MSSLKVTTVLLIMTLITACSVWEPFVDRRRNAGVQDMRYLYVGQSKPSRPVVCYNPLWTDDEKLQEMADQECQKHQTGTHAVFQNKKHFSCRLLLPARAYYTCVKDKKDTK